MRLLDESEFPLVAYVFTGFAPRQFLRLDPRFRSHRRAGRERRDALQASGGKLLEGGGPETPRRPRSRAWNKPRGLPCPRREAP